MRKMKIATVMLALALSLGTFAGCADTDKPQGNSGTGSTDTNKTEGTKTDSTQKVELVLGAMGFQSSEDDKYWPTAITQEIEKELNITLKTIKYDEEKLNLDLAAGQLCDMMMVYPKHLDGVLKGKHAVELDSYFDTIAKDINSEKMQLRNNIMREYRSDGADKVFFTTPSVGDIGFGETAAILGIGYGVRYDLYKEIGAPAIYTGDEYIDAMKKMKALYPQTEEGLPVYAMSVYNDLGLHGWTMRGLLDKGYATLDGNCMYLIDVIKNESKHNVYQADDETPFWSDMKFYNKLWKEGLLDPDCFITKGEDMKDKYAKGQYLGTVVNWYDGDFYTNNSKEDPNTLKGFITLPSYMGWTNATYRAGWADKLFFVSSHSKNIERTVSLLNYFHTNEFARLATSGVEGVHWETADGKGTLKADTKTMKSDGARLEEWNKLGLGGWTSYMAQAETSIMADGMPASLWLTPEVFAETLNPLQKDFCETMNVEYPRQLLEKRIEEGKCIDQSTFNTAITACMPSAPKDINRIDNNCVEIVTTSLPGLVQAKGDAEFNAAKDKLLADLKAADIETAITWWIDNYNTAKKTVESLGK